MTLGPEAKKLIYVITFSIILIILIFFSNYDLFFNFASEFLAVIIGILLVFAVDRFWEAEKNKLQRKDLLANLYVELKRISSILTQGNLLYPMVWDSAVSSGELGLLTSEQVTKLANLYALIKGTEYEAKKVQDMKEDYKKAKGTPEAKRLEMHWSLSWKNQSDREKELRQKIDEILTEKWWG